MFALICYISYLLLPLKKQYFSIFLFEKVLKVSNVLYPCVSLEKYVLQYIQSFATVLKDLVNFFKTLDQ